MKLRVGGKMLAIAWASGKLVFNVKANWDISDGPVTPPTKEGQEIVYYDTGVYTPDLGNYAFRVEAYERPSHETIPIIGNEYFSTAVTEIFTEVDNLAPSATYSHRQVQKVDIFYNNSYYAYGNTLSSALGTMVNSLKSSGLNLDIKFIQCSTNGVKTVRTPYQYKYIQSVGGGNLGWNGDGAAKKYLSGSWLSTSVDIKQMAEDGLDAVRITVGMFHPVDMTTGEWLNYEDQRWDNIKGWEMNITGIGIVTSGDITVEIDRENGKMVVKGNGLKEEAVEIKNLTFNPSTITSGPIGAGLLGYGVSCSIGKWCEETRYTETTENIPTTFDESFESMNWRSDALKFALYANHENPSAYTGIPTESHFINEYSRLSSDSIYYIGVGSDKNMYWLNKAVNAFKNNIMGDNNSAICVNGQTNTYNVVNTTVKNFILSKIKSTTQESDYILVGQDVNWETEYRDSEHDLPLNFGANKFDGELANEWNTALTNKNPNAKLTAERWRFTQNQVYDNSLGMEGYSNTWIEQAPTRFLKPGLYRVNYKRRDNPLYPNVSDPTAFSNYRYWSNDYDTKIGA